MFIISKYVCLCVWMWVYTCECLYPLSRLPSPYYFLFFASDWSFAYFSSLVHLPYGQPQPLAFSSAVGFRTAYWLAYPPSQPLAVYIFLYHFQFKDCTEFVKKQGNLSPWIEILLLRQLAVSWDHSLQAWRLTGSWPHSEPSLATGSLCPRLERYQTGKGSFFVKGLPLLSLSPLPSLQFPVKPSGVGLCKTPQSLVMHFNKWLIICISIPNTFQSI